MLIFVLSPASTITSVLPETNLPGSQSDESVPFCSEGYDEDNFHQTGKESSYGCGSFKDKEIVFAGSYAEVVYHCSRNLRGNPEEGENVGTEDHDALEDKIKDAVVCAIFESLDLLHETKGSLKNFEELLTMARHMYCKRAGLGEDDKTVKKK